MRCMVAGGKAGRGVWEVRKVEEDCWQISRAGGEGRPGGRLWASRGEIGHAIYWRLGNRGIGGGQWGWRGWKKGSESGRGV